MYFVSLLIFFPSIWIKIAGSIELTSLVRGLGWKRVDVTVENQKQGLQLFKSLDSIGVQSRVVLPTITLMSMVCSMSSTYPQIFVSNQTSWTEFALCSTKRRPYMTLLLLDGIQTETILSNNDLKQVKTTAAFYSAQYRPSKLATIIQPSLIFTNAHEDRVIANPVNVLWNSSDQNYPPLIDININFQGLEAKSISMDWLPWYKHGGCDDNGEHCQACTGILEELVKIVKRTYNLTISCNFELSNVWGFIAVDGNMTDPNARFSGVMEKIIHGKHDLSLSTWTLTVERSLWIDFPICVASVPMMLMLNTDNTPSDLTFMLKAFSMESWLVIILMTGLGFGFFAGLYWLQKMDLGLAIQSEQADQIAGFTMWLLFVVVSAYYGGILTSYLIIKPSLPFETLRQGLLHPDWNLVTLAGMEIAIQEQLSDPVFAAYWEQLQKYPDTMKVDDMTEAFEKLATPGIFSVAPIPLLASEANENPALLDKINLRTILHETTDNGVIIKKYSPYTKLFNLAILDMINYGNMERALKINIGELQKSQVSDTKKVDIVELMLPFSILFGVICISPILLLLEHIHKRKENKEKLFKPFMKGVLSK